MFKTLLAGNGFEFRTYRVLDGEFPASVAECDGWLITGSRHGVYEDHPWIPPLEQFIRDCFAAHVPVVGICFGHQIVAQAMGGKVERFAEGWAVGATDYDFSGEKLTLNAWHRDQVTVRPDDAQVLACNDFCENAALVYGKRAFTVQAHPEFGDDFIQGLMDTRAKGVVPDDLLAGAAARMGQADGASLLADRIEAFFKAPRTLARGAA